MKVSDYIIKFFEENNVTDIFGYPGVGCGHLMNSLSTSKIKTHLLYHEQAESFAVCSYAQASHKIGIAYSTSGPGGTNLVTGIANAFCDSIPTLFIVGDKDYASLKKEKNVRQLTSQEIDIVNIVKPITKLSIMIINKNDIAYYLEKAFYTALNGRPGPVLLDIPSDIQRAEIDEKELIHFIPSYKYSYLNEVDLIISHINKSLKPAFLVGNGIKQAQLENEILKIAKKCHIPLLTTLVAIDLYTNQKNRIGYIGIDGDVSANRVVQECDLLITFGARLNFKQVCNNRVKFAENAIIIRIDTDKEELNVELHNEIKVCADLKYLIPQLVKKIDSLKEKNQDWLQYCINLKTSQIKKESKNKIAALFMNELSTIVPEDSFITIDVGSHRRWVMSDFQFKENQRLFQSSGLVSMGYSLPAAIGVYYATQKPVICINGDGGIMMNIQEMEFISRERIPINVIVMNNHCLGDIMEFQKKIFNGNYFTTTETSGYRSANFEKIAFAFDFKYQKISNIDDVKKIKIGIEPTLIEVVVPANL